MSLGHSPTPDYVGRFAPSPTGPLHMGSLIAAVASYLEARVNDGHWLVRIEDIDPPREVAGASDAILRSLESHALHWDGQVLYQNTRLDSYRDILDGLIDRGLVYACDCSRTKLRALGGPYPGICRDKGLPPRNNTALRLRVEPGIIQFDDLLQGSQQEDVADCVGDFILERRDGLVAYQLAVVVDDAWQGITHIIRGADLLDCSARQIYLQQTLGYTTPTYGHFPVITNELGNKLSKQTSAPALNDNEAVTNLTKALAFLGQKPPRDVPDTAEALLAHAVAHYNRSNIPQGLSIQGS